MLPDQCQLALKEWAVTVQALALGQQVLLLRKGGIHELGKNFRVVGPEFLLYPTYGHQREDLVKDVYQSSLAGRLGRTAPGRRYNLLPLGPGRRNHRSQRTGQGGRPVTPFHMDQRLRPISAALEAHAASLGPSATGLRLGAAGHRCRFFPNTGAAPPG